jgi:hypothetical protein
MPRRLKMFRVSSCLSHRRLNLVYAIDYPEKTSLIVGIVEVLVIVD